MRLFEKRFCFARRQRPLGALQLSGELLAYDGQFVWGFDADPYAAVADFHDGYCDFVANENPLANLSTEN